jgi:hypothetical protein
VEICDGKLQGTQENSRESSIPENICPLGDFGINLDI